MSLREEERKDFEKKKMEKGIMERKITLQNPPLVHFDFLLKNKPNTKRESVLPFPNPFPFTSSQNLPLQNSQTNL